jgi:RHS repeat-associated protein
VTGTINIPTGQSVCTTSGTTTVSFGGASEAFTWSGGAYVNSQGGGSTLTCNTGTQRYTYTTADGVVVVFGQFAAFSPAYANGGRVIMATWPDGMVVTYTYNSVTVSGTSASRLQSVNNNLGYQLKFAYQNDSPQSVADLTPWTTLASVTGVNNAFEYCSPSANSCTFTKSWPKVAYAAGTTNQQIKVTDPLGNASLFTYTTANPPANGLLVGIQRPGSPSGGNTTSIFYNASSQVVSISNSARVVGSIGSGAGAWSYAYSVNGATGTTTITDPNGHVRQVVSNLTTSEVTTDTIDPGASPHLNLVTSYLYTDSYNRLTEIDLPAGDKYQFAYDQGTNVRGNITQTTHVAVAGSPVISTSAVFDATCVQASKCNKPNYTIDALGKITNYAYSATTGQLTDVQLPAPGSIRPETKLTYSTSLYPWYIETQGGSATQGPNAISMLASTSTCQQTASCQGTADQAQSTLTYGAAGSANNLGLTQVVNAAGDSSVSATTSQTFDNYGNVATTTGPLGSAQKTAYFYDLNRQLLGVVGPLGAGQTTYPALVYTWSPNGQVTQVTHGKTTTQTIASVTVLEQQNIAYDALGRQTQASFVSGGTIQTLAQWTYDPANRLVCTATRMNPALFATPPASACVLGASGAYGSDRITLNAYDAADRLTSTTLGYLSPQQTTYATLGYTPNGAVQTVADSRNYLTTFFYDGFSRLTKIEYPKPSTPLQSDPSGYEGYTLDDNGNVLVDRRRNGALITYTYDALNRVTSKVFSANSAWDVDYCYDLLGRLKSAQLTTTANLCGTVPSATVAYAWDALGRATTETTAGRTLAYAYDAAGDRTSITWPDAVAISYDYDVLQRARHVLLGSYTVAVFSYDDHGRRSGITRANSGGAPTSYAYDGADRISTLTQSLTGTAAVTYTQGYDPASETMSSQVTNSSVLFHDQATSTIYTADGLDRYATVGGLTPTYDGRQNLFNLSSASPHFTYDSENNLLTGSGPTAMTLVRDALGRIQTKTASGTTETFLYSGSMLVGEYDSAGNVLARYVPGPGTDEAVVWYAGAGTTTPQWLHADPLGSTIAWSNATGGSLGTQAYDPFGQPAAWSGSRFAYTGQLMLGEAQLYDYKARAYSPSLGRFMQTDPAGYASDLNPYAYVGNGPLGLTDPSGMINPEEDPQEEPSCSGEGNCVPPPNSIPGETWLCWSEPCSSPTDFPPIVSTPHYEPFPFFWNANLPWPEGQSPGGGGGGGRSPQNQQLCHASSGESGFARALGYGSNAQDAAISAGKLAAPELAEDLDRYLGPVGYVFAIAGEVAQVGQDVANGTRPDVALVGAGTRLASPIAGSAIGAALGAPEGGIGAIPGSIIGLAAGAAAAPSLGRIAENGYLHLVGC